MVLFLANATVTEMYCTVTEMKSSFLLPPSIQAYGKGNKLLSRFW